MTKLTNTTEPQEEAPSKLTERQTLKSLVYPFKVIVFPFKTFKEIAQNPDIKGVILLAGIVLLATASVQFASASKIFLTLYTPPSGLLATNLFSGYLLSAMVESLFAFILNWLIYAGALLLIGRLLGEKGSPWRPFLILVGYAFSVVIIRVAVSAILISTLPQIDFQLNTWPPVTEKDAVHASDQINAIWGPTLAFQAGVYFNLLIDAWLVMLGAIAVHAYRQISWSKAATISLTAYFIYFILRFFVGSS